MDDRFQLWSLNFGRVGRGRPLRSTIENQADRDDDFEQNECRKENANNGHFPERVVGQASVIKHLLFDPVQVRLHQRVDDRRVDWLVAGIVTA